MMSASSSSPFHKFKFRRSQKSLIKRLHSVLDSCLERFECHKEDEYHFSSSEFVEGIPPFACEFATHNHLLAAADEDGRVIIYDTNKARHNSFVKEWSAHKNAIFDIAWSSSDPPRLLTASGDQSASLWDVRTATCLASFKQHRCSLKSVSFRPHDSHVFATGARDGSIMLWDDRSKKRSKDSSQLSVGVISEAHVNPLKKSQPKRRKKLASDLPAIDSSNSVSVVVFQKEDTLLSAGATDGIVKMWDLRMLKSTNVPFHQFPYAGTSNRRRGFSSLALSSNSTQLFASCTDSTIYEYDLSGVLGTQPISRYCGHMNSTFFVRAVVSPDDLYLLSGSSDNHAYIWKIGQPESPPVTLVGHEAEVTAVAWCPQDFTKVVTCSDDNTMRIWKMSSNETQTDDGPSSIIGKAERCQREASLNSQGHSEQLSSSRSSSYSSSWQSSQSSPSLVSQTSASTSSEKTGSQSSSLPSPVPSSTKKRKFSLRDWATTSPSPSRGPSPASPLKRTRSASTASSSKPGLSGVKASVSSGRKRNCDSAPLSVGAEKRVKVMTEEDSPRSGVVEHSVLCNRDESSSNESENLRTKGSLKLNNGTSSAEDEIASTEEKHICVDNELNKENAVCGKKSSTPDKKSASESKIHSPKLVDSSASSKNGTPGQRSPLKDDIPMNRASCLVSQPNQTPDKTNQIVSKQAKKNLSSYFSTSPKPAPTDEQCCAAAEESSKEAKKHHLEEGSRDRSGMQKNLETSVKGDEMQQQNVVKSVNDKKIKQHSPGKCLKNKRVGKIHKAMKRRNSAGTIEGYFSPVVKRHKSET